MRDYDALYRAQAQAAGSTTKSEGLSLPPGYLAGFNVLLDNSYVVTITAGAANVGGSLVKKDSDHQLEAIDWVVPRMDLDRHYFIYLSKDGNWKIDIIEPNWNDKLVYYEHPQMGWRAVGKMFLAGGNIVFAIKEVEKNEQTVTVAPYGFTGKSDYYCEEADNQITINAAIRYLHEAYNGGTVLMLAGSYSASASIDIPYSNIVLKGSGRNTSITSSCTTDSLTIATASTVGIEIRDFAITSSSTGNAGGHNVIHVDSAIGTIVEKIFITDAPDDAIDAYGAYGTKINHCYIDGWGFYADNCYAIRTYSGAAYDKTIVDGNVVTSTTSSSKTRAGIGGSGSTLTNNYIHSITNTDGDVLGITSTNSIISNNRISNLTASNAAHTAYGILSYNSATARAIISGNKIETISGGLYSKGITLTTVNNCVVSSNHIQEITSTSGDVYGMDIGGNYNAVSANVVEGCTTAGETRGIHSVGVTGGNAISNNLVYNNTTTGATKYCIGIQISTNYDSADGNTVVDNVNSAAATQGYGVYCAGGIQCRIANNLVTDNGYGIYVNSTTSTRVTGNTCYNNGTDTGLANTNSRNYLGTSDTDVQLYSNSWQQPVSGEPSYGTPHPHLETIVNADPSGTGDTTVTVTNVPAGTKMISGEASVQDAAGALRYLYIKTASATVWRTISNYAFTGAFTQWFEVPLNSSKQFIYSVSNADVDNVTIDTRLYYI